jgi:hypothetical protein
MKQALESAFLLATILSATASADVRRGTAWLQGPQSQGFGTAEVDVDDETLVVSVIVDFEGLSSACLGGHLLGQGGETLCTLDLAGGGDTVFGTAALTQAQVVAVLSGQSHVVLETTAQPQGEIDGSVSGDVWKNFSYPFSPAQVVPPQTSVATGTGFVALSAFGEAGFSGQLHDLQGAITSIELWRDAWFNDPGTFVTSFTSIGFPSPGFVTFHGTIPSLTPELQRDLADGTCFVIVRTSLFPQGELRGQMRPPTLGSTYCTGRPNSVSIWGARLSLEGSPIAAANDVVLHASSLPAGKAVLPILGFGTGHVFNPGGLGGMLCVAGAGVGRMGTHAGVASTEGTYDVALDLARFGIGGSVQTLQPGMRLNLQLWYRDPQGPTPSNFTGAASVVFH